MILHICWQDGVRVEGSSLYGFIQKCLGFFSSTGMYWRPNIYKINGLIYSSVEKAGFHKKSKQHQQNKDFGLEYSI